MVFRRSWPVSIKDTRGAFIMLISFRLTLHISVYKKPTILWISINIKLTQSVDHWSTRSVDHWLTRSVDHWSTRLLTTGQHDVLTTGQHKCWPLVNTKCWLVLTTGQHEVFNSSEHSVLRKIINTQCLQFVSTCVRESGVNTRCWPVVNTVLTVSQHCFSVCKWAKNIKNTSALDAV